MFITQNILGSSEMMFIFPNIEGFWTAKLSQFGHKCIINSGNLIKWLLLGLEISIDLGGNNNSPVRGQNVGHTVHLIGQ